MSGKLRDSAGRNDLRRVDEFERLIKSLDDAGAAKVAAFIQALTALLSVRPSHSEKSKQYPESRRVD